MQKFSWYWSEKSHNAWADVRKMGRWKFILYNGVVRWGVPMFLVMACSPVFFWFTAHWLLLGMATIALGSNWVSLWMVHMECIRKMVSEI